MFKKKKYYLVFVVWIFFYALYLTLKNLSSKNTTSNEDNLYTSGNHLTSIASHKKSTSLLQILLWHGAKTQNGIIKRHLICPISDVEKFWTSPDQVECNFTVDREDYNTSDVILFRHRFLLSGMPKYRIHWQKWLLFEFEPAAKISPSALKRKTEVYQNVFNITAHPVEDADIVTYRVFNSVRYVMDQKLYDSFKGSNFARGKTKMAAWFVSHCQTPSQREIYVEELSKYISVDVFGECGPLKCGYDNKTRFEWSKEKVKDEEKRCDKEVLEPHYKFYIAFENSFCENYLTEKVHRLYKNNINIVPVVAGSVDYTWFFPSGSFIDVRDFKNESDLAKYLQFLDTHDDLYNEYLRRKRSAVRFSDEDQAPKRSLDTNCGICRYLHENKDRNQVVHNAMSFYDSGKRCETPHQFFHGRVQNISRYKDRFDIYYKGDY